MEISHLHVEFQDLNASVAWMKRVLGKDPKFQNSKMALFQFGTLTLNFDQAERDSKITLALKSEDCDKDFASIAAQDVEVIEPPNTKPYGVRSAYIKGPGQVVFEVDQAIAPS